MKLYNPDTTDHFVFCVVPAGAKEGTPGEYKAVPGNDFEHAYNTYLGAKWRMAAPYVMGRYDHLGRYCTYCPSIEGVKPGRFVLHPLADQE